MKENDIIIMTKYIQFLIKQLYTLDDGDLVIKIIEQIDDIVSLQLKIMEEEEI